jgi:hypothetical protein
MSAFSVPNQLGMPSAKKSIMQMDREETRRRGVRETQGNTRHEGT